jgi:hypothetical protein
MVKMPLSSIPCDRGRICSAVGLVIQARLQQPGSEADPRCFNQPDALQQRKPLMNNSRIKPEAYAHALQKTATPAGQYSDAERHALLKTVLESVAEQEPLRVFAYGSLLWRPGVRPVEVQIATVHGWRRSLDIDALTFFTNRDARKVWSLCGKSMCRRWSAGCLTAA